MNRLSSPTLGVALLALLAHVPSASGNGINTCPVADASTVTVAENGSVNFDLPASDADGNPLTYIVTQAPAHGVSIVNAATGAASYTPARGYCGPDSFKFKVNDGFCDSAEATVSITVTCPPPALGCRVTGGAVSSAGETNPILSFEIATAKGSGQVGAPCGSVGCFDEAGHIEGVWQHARKKRRGNFLAKQFTSLACNCLNADGTASFGAPCRPDSGGPEPRPAPANVACFAGSGAYADVGTRRRNLRVAFRVEVEDHGEPGAGGTAPSDKYRIRIWIPQSGETLDQLVADACCCNPEPVNGASRRPDVDDGGTITHGNIQIHPQTPAQFDDCPVPDDSCPLCGNGQVDGNEECDPPGSTCRGGCNPLTQTCVEFECNPDCTCPPPVCGDQFVDQGEECDPPDSQCGDGTTCSATCACVQACGNGHREPGEECDVSPDSPRGGCSPGEECTNCECVPTCGNGQKDPGEACDATSSGPGCEPGYSCNQNCQCVPSCGNGTVDAGEDCEPPNTPGGCASGLSCDATCQCVQTCGNGHREPGEECDVSPDSPRGGCSPGEECTNCECVSTCGNGQKDPGEACDATASGPACETGFTCNQNCECISSTPDIDLIKTATPRLSALPLPGDTIQYGFRITNVGQVTLTGVDLTDALVGYSGQACGATTTLAPTAATTCSADYTITQADIDAGSIHNSATACGTPPAGADACDPDSTDTPLAQSPSIDLVKSATPHLSSPPTAGDTIDYRFEITNTGNVTLTGVDLDDTLLGLTDATCAVTTLAPGAMGSCTGTYTVTQSDIEAGHVANTATACGTPPVGPDVCDPDGTDTSLQ